MKKKALLAAGLLAAITMTTSKPAAAAVVVGGANGWEFSTDGIVDLFSYYTSTGKGPGAGHALSLLSVGGNEARTDERFGTGIGLLPSVVAFNIKAPTTNGVDSSVRVGIYPALQNGDQFNGENNKRFSTSPNIDFREFFYTAKGSYGELLVGRALNLYQGKNILNDMTLLSAGVVPGNAFHNNTTLGHIGYGYLYTNFGPQFRYTTPDFSGTKVAVSIGEPYQISEFSAKRNTPRMEAEVSYAKTYDGTAVQAWLSGLYQSDTRSETAGYIGKRGDKNTSAGAAYGVTAALKNGLGLMASGYYGSGLGTVSVQDGDFLGSTSTDAVGEERTHWGFLVQATYKITPTIVAGINYGQTRQDETDFDKTNVGVVPIKNQEAATTSVTYAFNSFTKFTAEYTWAQNTWHDDKAQRSNQFALGSTFFW